MEFPVSNLYVKIFFSVLVTVYIVDIPGIKVAAIDVIPDTFQTTIQVNLLEERSSALLRYYYDGKEGRQSVRIIENQKEEFLLINNKNKTVYYLSKSKINCEQSDLNLDKLRLWQYFLFGGKPLLKMISNFSKPIKSNHEDGTETFDARGTIYDGNYAATFDIIGEMRENQWSTVMGWKNVPVRFIVKGNLSAIIVKGNMSAININQSVPYQYQYDFFNFTGNIDDMSVFEIPEGMMCKDFHDVEEFPDIGKDFHVKLEKIQPSLNKLLEEEWWFESGMMVARHDYKPWNSETSIFEVHDYINGVQYAMNPTTGHCDIKPLAPWKDNEITDVEAVDINGTRYLKMNSPNDLFDLNGIYFKKGSTMVRGIPCDVYITSRQKKVEDSTIYITLEYYILSSSWQPQKKPVPVKLMITTERGVAEIYNFVSYEDVVQDFSVFDVTPCYSERAQLHFQISIPGKYNPEIRFPLMNKARQHLKEAAHVSFLRIQGVTLDYDADEIYLSAILLGRNKPIELFTKLPYGCDKPPGNHIVAVNASSLEMCAQLCIDRSLNVSDDSLSCNSFYFHINQPEGTVNLCRLSSLQKVNDTKYGSEDWECFYRTVRGEDKFDISSMQAWTNIKANVSKGGFKINFVQQDMTYLASNAEINFGFIYETGEPDPPEHFYMKAELIIHEDTRPPVVQDREVWYDYKRKLLRIHSNFPSSMDDLTTAEMDRIYDFNSGYMYIIGSKCMSRQIVFADTEAIFYNETLRDASMMKDAKSMLHMNGKAIFSGQKRVREILSDVFLYHSPFYTPMNHINYTKVLHRVFFKTERQSNGSEKATNGDRIPVRIETSGLNSQFVMYENIFNFLTSPPELRNFDISQCYSPKNVTEICVNMSATDDLPDGYQSKFLDYFQNSLASITQVSPLRFQDVKLISERKKLLIVRFVVLPLTEDQGKTGMVPTNKLLQLIETEAKNANIALAFQDQAKKIYRAVSSSINRQYPMCSNIRPKAQTTEQPTVTSCPTSPTACPTLPKAATIPTKFPFTTTRKKTTPTTTTASTPTIKPSTSISTSTPSTTTTTKPTTTTKTPVITKSVKTTEVTTGSSVTKMSFEPHHGSGELSVGKVVGLSFGMLFIGMILGAILYRSLFKERKPVVGEWFPLQEDE